MPDNVELFRRVIERGFNHGDLSVADEICAKEFAEHQYLLPKNLPGPEILKIEIQAARREIEDLTLSIEDIVAQGEKVWARMIARGRDPRSGRDVSIDVMDVCRFSEGRMVEHWGIPDRSPCSTSSASCLLRRHDRPLKAQMRPRRRARPWALIRWRTGTGDLTARPLRDRRARLEDVVGGSESVFPVRRLAPDGVEAWRQVLERGDESLVLLEVGLESDIGDLLRAGLQATLVAFVGVVLPFAVGYGVMYALGSTMLVAVFVGATLTATSVGITARVLTDLGRLQEAAAKVVLGAAVVDDILGLIIESK